MTFTINAQVSAGLLTGHNDRQRNPASDTRRPGQGTQDGKGHGESAFPSGDREQSGAKRGMPADRTTGNDRERPLVGLSVDAQSGLGIGLRAGPILDLAIQVRLGDGTARGTHADRPGPGAKTPAVSRDDAQTAPEHRAGRDPRPHDAGRQADGRARADADRLAGPAAAPPVQRNAGEPVARHAATTNPLGTAQAAGEGGNAVQTGLAGSALADRVFPVARAAPQQDGARVSHGPIANEARSEERLAGTLLDRTAARTQDPVAKAASATNDAAERVATVLGNMAARAQDPVARAASATNDATERAATVLGSVTARTAPSEPRSGVAEPNDAASIASRRTDAAGAALAADSAWVMQAVAGTGADRAAVVQAADRTITPPSEPGTPATGSVLRSAIAAEGPSRGVDDAAAAAAPSALVASSAVPSTVDDHRRQSASLPRDLPPASGYNARSTTVSGPIERIGAPLAGMAADPAQFAEATMSALTAGSFAPSGSNGIMVGSGLSGSASSATVERSGLLASGAGPVAPSAPATAASAASAVGLPLFNPHLARRQRRGRRQATTRRGAAASGLWAILRVLGWGRRRRDGGFVDEMPAQDAQNIAPATPRRRGVRAWLRRAKIFAARP